MRLIVVVLLYCLSLTVWAESRSLNVPANKVWQQECGSCHLAYPPGLLAADDWRRLMRQLDKHFGSDASLEDAEAREISRFLQRYGAQGRRYAAKSLRISGTSWFKHEHDEVQRRVWQDPSIKSPANCAGCHVDAAKGDWSEHGVRMPGRGKRGEDDDEGDDD